MLLASVVLLIAVTVLFTLSIRVKDVPPPDPVSPTRHLEERKAAIYENLRDLQFEYRVGKLSDDDYQQTKLGLQKELSVVLAEIDSVTGAAPRPAAKAAAATPHPTSHTPANETAAEVAPAAAPPAAVTEAEVTTPMAATATAATATAANVCPHCGATMPRPMKFCGECGKAMQ